MKLFTYIYKGVSGYILHLCYASHPKFVIFLQLGPSVKSGDFTSYRNGIYDGDMSVLAACLSEGSHLCIAPIMDHDNDDDYVGTFCSVVGAVTLVTRGGLGTLYCLFFCAYEVRLSHVIETRLNGNSSSSTCGRSASFPWRTVPSISCCSWYVPDFRMKAPRFDSVGDDA